MELKNKTIVNRKDITLKALYITLYIKSVSKIRFAAAVVLPAKRKNYTFKG